jgi:predicted AlkP superfamily pyrophosphatase or phosphodiesterase
MKSIYSKTHSLVNLSNTILAHYQIPTPHPSIPSLLQALKNKQKIVFLLFDGMGQIILRKHLPFYAWLRRQRMMSITSTFPSTTAAATNAFLSAQYPNQIGWLGWAQYFPEHDKILELFTGKDSLLQQPAVPAPELQKTIQYQSIFQRLQQQHPTLTINQVWPDVRPGGFKTIDAWFEQLHTLAQQQGPSFTYGYWLDPDKSIHKEGTNSKVIQSIVKDIQHRLKTLAQNNPDTTYVIFADHGLIDVTFLNIQEHQDLFQLLKRSFSLEPRAATFFVKDQKSNEFVQRFHQYYGQYFLLLTKQEVKDQHLYGIGPNHPRFDEFIGDFVAIAKGKFGFTHGTPNDTMPKNMKAHHAGMTKAEMMIDVMVLNR